MEEEKDNKAINGKQKNKRGIIVSIIAVLLFISYFTLPGLPFVAIGLAVLYFGFYCIITGFKKLSPARILGGVVISLPILALITAIMVPSINHRRYHYDENVCIENLKQAYLFLYEYMNENGKYPESLDIVFEDSYDLLKCLADKSGQEISYEYLGSGLTDGTNYNLIIMYDKEPWHKGQKRCVLFGDGHVEAMGENLFQDCYKRDVYTWAKLSLRESLKDKLEVLSGELLQKGSDRGYSYTAVIENDRVYLHLNEGPDKDSKLGPFIRRNEGEYYCPQVDYVGEGRLTKDEDSGNWWYCNTHIHMKSESVDGVVLDEIEDKPK